MTITLRRTGIAAAVAAALALAAHGASAAQVDYFLKIDGINGESTDDKHKGEIVIESWSWGVTQSAIGTGNRAPTRGCPTAINFSKFVDLSTPALMLSAVNGATIPKATLVGRKAGQEQQEFLKIELTNILVSSYSVSGGAGDSLPYDAFALNFSSASIEYREQKPDGTIGGTPKAGFQGGC
jgi:type VI secretion system secreted protein Hcp